MHVPVQAKQNCYQAQNLFTHEKTLLCQTHKHSQAFKEKQTAYWEYGHTHLHTEQSLNGALLKNLWPYISQESWKRADRNEKTAMQIWLKSFRETWFSQESQLCQTCHACPSQLGLINALYPYAGTTCGFSGSMDYSVITSAPESVSPVWVKRTVLLNPYYIHLQLLDYGDQLADLNIPNSACRISWIKLSVPLIKIIATWVGLKGKNLFL